MIYAFEDCVLDPARRELRRGGMSIDVEPQVFDLLELLIRHRTRVVSKDELISAVWNGRIISELAFSTRMTAVRQAIGDSGEAQRLIRTIPRKGIRFVGEVREERECSAREKATTQPSALDLVLRPQLSIVVLPFANLNNDPEQEHLVDGIVDDLTTDLTRLEGSFVIARNTAMTYKGLSLDMQELGRDLGVRHALEGSVRRFGSKCRINAQLIDTESGGHLWAETFDGDVSALMALSDEVTLCVGRALKVNLVNAASRRIDRREAPDAVDLVLRGRSILNGRITRENYAQARSFFTRALEIAPDSIGALVGVGVANVVEYANFITPPDGRELLATAEDVLNRALDIEPYVAWGRYGRAFVLTIKKQLDAARFEARTAIDLDRTLSPAYIRLAQIETSLGRPEEALRLTEQALRISPKEPRAGHAFYAAAHAHTLLGNDEQAQNLARQALSTGFKSYLAYSYLAAALANLGRIDEARRVVGEMLIANPEITLARLYANRRSDHPGYLSRWQRYLDGLRAAGLPES